MSYSDAENNLRMKSLQDVEQYVSKEQYIHFVQGNAYVNTVANDDRAFLEQLPGYRVKPLYILLAGLVGKAFDNISIATVLVSSIGFLLVGIVLYYLRPSGYLEPFYLLGMMLFMYLGTPAFTLFPSASTPDSLAIGLTLLGISFLCRNPNTYLPAIVFSLAVLARPDTIITLICLTPFAAKLHDLNKISSAGYRYLLLTILLPVCIYVSSKIAFPSFGLKQLIVFTFTGPYPYLASIDTSNFWQIYQTALLNDLVKLSSIPRFLILVGINVLLLFIAKEKYLIYLLMASLVNIIVKIILFPNFDFGYGERFFFTSYFLIIYSLFEILASRTRKFTFSPT